MGHYQGNGGYNDINNDLKTRRCGQPAFKQAKTNNHGKHMIYINTIRYSPQPANNPMLQFYKSFWIRTNINDDNQEQNGI